VGSFVMARLYTDYTLSSRKQLFYITRRNVWVSRNPKNEDLVGQNAEMGSGTHFLK
jgi:hypothetical protein